jgi:hypothetical protein
VTGLISTGSGDDLLAARGFPALNAENMEKIFSDPVMTANFEKWANNPGKINAIHYSV